MVLFETKPETRKFYIVYYIDPTSEENKFLFADTFELACDRAESVIRNLPKETAIKIRIFEEVLAFIKPSKDKDKIEKTKRKKAIKIRW